MGKVGEESGKWGRWELGVAEGGSGREKVGTSGVGRVGEMGDGGEVGDAGEIGLEVWGRKGVGLGGGGASGRWGRGKVGNG